MVDGDGGVSGGRGINRGGLVGRGGLVSRGRLVSGGRLVGGGSFVGSGSGGVLCLAGVGHISNISAVGIVNLVVDSLSSAVGKSDTVGAGGGVAVSVLSGLEVGTGVIVGNGVSVSVNGGLVIFGLSGVVGGLDGCVVDGLGGSVVNGFSGSVVDGLSRSVVNGGSVVNGLSGSISGGRLIDGSRGVVNRGRGSLVHWGRLVNRGRGMIDGGGVSRGGSVIHGGGLVWYSCGSVNGGHWLLITSIPMHGLGSGVGLAADSSMGRKVGLVHGMAYGGGIAQLDGLMVGLVGGNTGHKKGSS